MNLSEPASPPVEVALPVARPAPWEPSAFFTWAVLGFLLVQYCVFFTLTSLAKSLWIDELYVFFTARADSLARLLHVQKDWPLGIEPPLYSILAHGFLLLFPHHNRIVRMPAAIGFLLFVLSLFFFLKRAGGTKLASIAIAILLVTSTVYYASEARPYGMMYGMWGCSLFFWQSARLRGQWPAVIGLGLATAIGINSHYFAILMPLPILCAEALRLRAPNAYRWRVLGAIACGYATALLWLPFLKGAALYSKNYGRGFEMAQLATAYRLMLSLLPIDLLIRNLVSVPFLLLAFLGFALLLRRHSFTRSDHAAEWIALCVSCLLPLFGAALALKAHGTLEPRYALYGITGFCALAGLALSSRIQRPLTLLMTLAIIACLACLQEASVVNGYRQLNATEWQPLPPATGDEKIVMADFGKFLLMEAAPNPSPKVIYLYDGREEIKHFNSDYMTHTAVNAAEIGNLPIYSSSSFLAANPHFAVAAWRDYDSWWFYAWADEGLKVDRVDKAGDWTLYQVSAQHP